MSQLIDLDPGDLGILVALVGVAIALSAWQKIGLEFKFAIAAGRSIVQLLILGYVLDFIFALNNIWAVVGILAVMLTVSAIVTRNGISKKIPLLLPLLWISMFTSTSVVLLYVNFLIIQPEPWYAPQYVIPLGGMVLSSAMNAAAIAGERLVKTVNASQWEIETHLSLGATPQQAIAAYRREAIGAALIPSINQMAVAGIFMIPGFMGGILLSGVDQNQVPLQAASSAASYQILLLFMMAVANLLTTVLLTRGLCRQFFNAEAQLK